MKILLFLVVNLLVFSLDVSAAGWLDKILCCSPVESHDAKEDVSSFPILSEEEEAELNLQFQEGWRAWVAQKLLSDSGLKCVLVPIRAFNRLPNSAK